MKCKPDQRLFVLLGAILFSLVGSTGCEVDDERAQTLRQIKPVRLQVRGRAVSANLPLSGAPLRLTVSPLGQGGAGREPEELPITELTSADGTFSFTT